MTSQLDWEEYVWTWSGITDRGRDYPVYKLVIPLADVLCDDLIVLVMQHPTCTPDTWQVSIAYGYYRMYRAHSIASLAEAKLLAAGKLAAISGRIAGAFTG